MKVAGAFLGRPRELRARHNMPIPSLVPPASAVPTPAEKQQYDDDDDQKGCVVHIVLLRGSWRR
jgi:hypothetical protein